MQHSTWQHSLPWNFICDISVPHKTETHTWKPFWTNIQTNLCSAISPLFHSYFFYEQTCDSLLSSLSPVFFVLFVSRMKNKLAFIRGNCSRLELTGVTVSQAFLKVSVWNTVFSHFFLPSWKRCQLLSCANDSFDSAISSRALWMSSNNFSEMTLIICFSLVGHYKTVTLYVTYNQLTSFPDNIFKFSASFLVFSLQFLQTCCL